ncbi:MAG: hypothetical protein IJV50_08470 [Lachnospiraceae bacterium]|nr:hypothetical protein [Lachnospiraceae bacterium]
MKHKKIIALTATLVLSFGVCAGCGNQKAAENTTVTAMEQEPTDVTVIGSSVSVELEGENEIESSWENPFSFQVSVNDVVMALPAPVQQMLDAGFIFPTNLEDTLAADSTSTFRMESTSGDTILITLVNTTQEELPLEDCTLSFLMLDQNSAENTEIALTDDITYGTSEAVVRKFMGVEPNDEIIDDGVTHLTYHKNGDPQEFADWIEFQFEDGGLTAVLMQVNAYGGYQA